MKFCVGCKHAKKEYVQTPQGHGSILVCTHSECLHPVDASLLPCEVLRKQDVFCGFSARYFEPKEIVPEPQEQKGGLIVTNE